MLKNVQDELCKAFEVGLFTATTELGMQLVAALPCRQMRDTIGGRPIALPLADVSTIIWRLTTSFF